MPTRTARAPMPMATAVPPLRPLSPAAVVVGTSGAAEVAVLDTVDCGRPGVRGLPEPPPRRPPPRRQPTPGRRRPRPTRPPRRSGWTQRPTRGAHCRMPPPRLRAPGTPAGARLPLGRERLLHRLGLRRVDVRLLGLLV